MLNRLLSLLFFMMVLSTVSAQRNSNNGAAQPKTTAAEKELPGQPKTYHAEIRVMAKAAGDSVILRWGPTGNWAWTILNRTGYLIERIDISEPHQPKRQIITPAPVKPMTLEQFKSSFGKDNHYAAIAAQCLYGKNFNVNIRKGQGGVQDKASVWTDRYGFAMQVADFDGGVARAEALRFTDTHVKAGGIYIYRVYAAQFPAKGKIDTGNVMVQNIKQTVTDRPKLTETVATDKLAELHWGRMQREQYTGYQVERSDDGVHFKSLTRVPFYSSKPDSLAARQDSLQKKIAALLNSQQVYVDSLPQNYHTYYYRIRGINAFAEWSNYSDTLTASGLDLTAPSAPILSNPKYVSGKQLRLQWKKPVKENDFKGYIVTRAHNSVAGPYTALTQTPLPPSATQYTDTAAFAHGQNYYIILAADTAGNMGSSIPAMGLVPDNIPPAIPTGLKGHIGKNGLVHLSWHPDSDEDIKGYKVYFANGPEHVYSQVTLKPVTDTVYTDSITLHTLTKTIWYKIAAVDQNNNHSLFSQAVQLKKPDIVPPMPPLTSKVLVDTGGVKIDWIPSSSIDVVKYAIYRSEKKNQWTLLALLAADTTKKLIHYTDLQCKPFTTYSYSAESIDEDSLRSARSTPAYATIKTIPDLPALTTLTATYDDKTRMARLHWQYKAEGHYFFVLYKAEGNNPLERYRSFHPEESEFTDDQLVHPGSIRYAIQVIFNDKRGRTRPSNPVVINALSSK